ncbi:UNVERIFIED_CONTAM: Copia protein [Sesamum latifolium]|uniref:Copia protein n=1 Tax=Sesamum latifolium TaxID=2727402 RepID=A0AAW2X5A1_9LAMI
METNKFNGSNYNDWQRNLRIVLDFKNQGYILDKPLPAALPEGSSPEERLTFEKWHVDNRKICRDKSILRDQDGRRIVCAESWVKMLSLVEKLKDLKAGLNNDTYIDVILQSLPQSYDLFIVNYNMNGLEKSIHELINMLVQYEATTHKYEPAVLVGDASTSKAKGKGARRWKRKKGKKTTVKATASTGGAPAAPTGKGQREGIFVVEVNMISNSAIWQMNVKMAFLNGFIEEEIFMDQPEGFTAVGEEQKNDYDPCIYKKISGSSVVYLVLYVDDILIIGNDVKMLADIKAWLSTLFSMKDMGEASYILGIKIYRDRSRRMLGLT